MPFAFNHVNLTRFTIHKNLPMTSSENLKFSNLKTLPTDNFPESDACENGGFHNMAGWDSIVVQFDF